MYDSSTCSRHTLLGRLPLAGALLAAVVVAACAPAELPAPSLFPSEMAENNPDYERATRLRTGEGGDRNYAHALEELRHLASHAGDTRAMNDIGIMYAKGQGVERNYRTAVSWFSNAAQKGNSSARYNLGVMHLHGLGVSQNTERAIILLNDAAMQGNPRAQVLLADIYSGHGVDSLNGEALRLYRRAAESGQIDSWRAMGNTPEGSWLRKLGERPHNIEILVSNMLVEAYSGHEGVHHHWKRKGKEREVLSLRDKSRKGDNVARYNLGLRYLKGDGVPPDRHEGARWMTLAAIDGYAPAQYQLASMYMDGRGVTPNAVAAWHWLSKASNARDKELARAARQDLEALEARMSPDLLSYAQEWSDKYPED